MTDDINTIDPAWLSDCHNAAVYVVGSDEGTNHYECLTCKQSCNFHDANSSNDDQLDEILHSLAKRIEAMPRGTTYNWEDEKAAIKQLYVNSPSPMSDSMSDNLSQCHSCWCMTHTVNGRCGKCTCGTADKPVEWKYEPEHNRIRKTEMDGQPKITVDGVSPATQDIREQLEKLESFEFHTAGCSATYPEGKCDCRNEADLKTIVALFERFSVRRAIQEHDQLYKQHYTYHIDSSASDDYKAGFQDAINQTIEISKWRIAILEKEAQ